MLLRETPLEGAREFAERLRGRLEQHFLRTNPAAPVTASLGVSALGEAMRKPSELMEAADRALYESKRAGRNRVSRAPASPGLELVT